MTDNEDVKDDICDNFRVFTSIIDERRFSISLKIRLFICIFYFESQKKKKNNQRTIEIIVNKISRQINHDELFGKIRAAK
jgi:hypothetical protein